MSSASSTKPNSRSDRAFWVLAASAGSAVNKAVHEGRLPRVSTHTCERCQEAQAQHYHHEDYAPEHWLEVVPLCVRCHKQRHAEIKAEADPTAAYSWRDLFGMACDLEINDCAWRKSATRAELISSLQALNAL